MERQGTTHKADERRIRQPDSGRRSSTTYVRVGWIAGAFCVVLLVGSWALSAGPERKTLEWYGIEASDGPAVPASSNRPNQLEWAQGGAKVVKEGVVVFERTPQKAANQGRGGPPVTQQTAPATTPASLEQDNPWAAEPPAPNGIPEAPPSAPAAAAASEWPVVDPPTQGQANASDESPFGFADDAPEEGPVELSEESPDASPAPTPAPSPAAAPATNSYLEEAQELLEAARVQALRGNFLRARQLAVTASMLPVEWPSPAESANAFLQELQSFPGFAEAVRNRQAGSGSEDGDGSELEQNQAEPADAATVSANTEPTGSNLERKPEPPAAAAARPTEAAVADAAAFKTISAEPTEPAVPQTPAIAETAPADSTQPTGTQSTATQPTVAQPSATQPTVGQPSAAFANSAPQKQVAPSSVHSESSTARSGSSSARPEKAFAVESAWQAKTEASDPFANQPQPKSANTAGPTQASMVKTETPPDVSRPDSPIKPAVAIEIPRERSRVPGGIEIYRGSVRQGAPADERVVTPQEVPSTAATAGSEAQSRSAFYRNEAEKLLEQARRRALQGDFVKARQLARSASTLPVDWESGEDTPQKFLSELESFPGYAEAIGGKPVPVELSATPGTTKPQAASEAPVEFEPLRISVDETVGGSREPRDDARSVLRPLPKLDPADQKPPADGPRAADVAALKPSGPSVAQESQVAATSGNGLRVAPGFLPPAPSRGETLFTNVLVNLITIFAALVFGLFALLSAVMVVFRSKLKGGGLNLRVELVTNRPLATLSVTSGAAPAAGVSAGAPQPAGSQPARTWGEAATAASSEGEEEGSDLDAIALAFDPPILSLAEQRKAEEEELRMKEQAILAQILEQNIELRERLQEMEGQPQ